MSDRIVMFSGGAGSWATARRVAERHGTDDLILLFADTKTEDEDLYRFLDEAARDVGGELVKVAEGRDPWQVFFDKRYLGNSRIDPCSRILKRELLRDWLKVWCEPEETTIYLGIDWTEEHRFDKARKYWDPWTVEAPLCEPPYVDKMQMLEQMRACGIEPPRLYAMGFAHNNCFAGDTKVPTASGVLPLKELEGEEVRVLTSEGMRTGFGRSFGVQPFRRIVLSRSGRERVEHVTADHRWVVEDARRTRQEVRATDELRAGDILATFDSDPGPCELLPNDVARGVVFGDGTTPARRGASAWIVLCGEKVELEPWFPRSGTVHPAGRRIGRLPREWKERPKDTHWPSWLAGYFAADGSITAKSASISTTHPSDVDLIRHAAFMSGVPVTGVSSYVRMGFGVHGTVYEVGLRMPEHLVLRSRHREAWSPPRRAPRRWKVVRVEETDRVERVWCLTVPGPHDFSLLDGLATLNCGGFCIKAGKAHFERLLREMPERYRYHEEQEQRLQDYLSKPVTILREQVDGERRRLSLRQFRERLEGGEDNPDPYDWGGCGCFSPTDDSD